MTQAIDIQKIVEQINALLKAGEPGNITEDSYNNKTGYQPQAIFDAINATLSADKWGFEEVSMKGDTEVEPKIVVCSVRVWLGDKECSRSAYGQARITKGDLGDAYKGAQTDAIKKALSYFSIGNRAYLGQLEKSGKSRPSVAPARPTTTAPVAAAPITSSNGAEKPISAKQVEFMTNLLEQKGFTVGTIYTKYGVTIQELTSQKASQIIETLQKMNE